MRQIGWSLVLCPAICLLVTTSDAAGQWRNTASSQGEVDKAFLEIVQRRCSECHGTDVERKGGEARGKFDHVTDLPALAKNANLVVPGNPDQSKLWRVVEKDFMPYEADLGEREPLSKAEKEAVRAWIASLKAQAVAKRNPISELEVVGYVQRDLAAMTAQRAKYARYFTLVNLYNAGISDKGMELSRAGLFKLINSLSRGPRPIVPVAIDSDSTIYRVFIDDGGWTLDQWERFSKTYPYGIDRGTKAETRAHQKAGTSTLIMRADWFVFRASRPPAYYELLGIPRTAQELEKSLGVDVSANIENQKALRAGFQQSGVSRNNRLVERHEISTGAYWKSYDFRDNAGQSDLFSKPLGPGGGQFGFEHAGGEIIFNLPNGFQAYMLVNGNGQRLDKGPTDIVQDKNRADGTIINGISCMSCHDSGMKTGFKDEVRAVAERAAAFDGRTLRQIKALYRTEDELQRDLKLDQDRFLSALKAANIDPSLRSRDREPVISVSDAFEAPVTLRQAAAELGLTEEELSRQMAESADLRVLKSRLQVTGVPRDQFVAAFSALVGNLDLGHWIDPDPLKEYDVDPLTGCHLKRQAVPTFSFSWSGPCVDGLAQGNGVLRYFKDGKPDGYYEGELRGGLRIGRGTLVDEMGPARRRMAERLGY